MKISKNTVKIVVSIFLIFLLQILSISKTLIKKGFSKSIEIAKPIIVLEKDDKINANINENSFPIEYNFSINNYDENGVNEIDFNYVIELENSNENFPVSYKLFDSTSGEEITLKNGKSRVLKIDKYKKSRKFKLIINWRELDCDLEDKLKIQLKINVIQSEEF